VSSLRSCEKTDKIWCK